MFLLFIPRLYDPCRRKEGLGSPATWRSQKTLEIALSLLALTCLRGFTRGRNHRPTNDETATQPTISQTNSRPGIIRAAVMILSHSWLAQCPQNGFRFAGSAIVTSPRPA